MRRARLIGLSMLAVAVVVPAAHAQACTVTWDGDLGTRWFDFDPGPTGNANDDITNWSDNSFPDANDDVCIPAGPANQPTTNQVTQNTPDMRTLTIDAGASLTVSDVQAIVRENSVNNGTLNMAGPVPMTISDGDPADHEGLTNTGTINFPALAGNGLQILKGDLLNQGSINVDDPDASIQAADPAAPARADQSNQGTINISSGNALRVLSANFVNGAGGVITGAGSMNMAQARFEAGSGSQIVAPVDVNMTTGTFAGAAGSTATGNVDVYGAFNGGGPSVLEGTVPAGITLDVEPGVTLQSPPVDTTVNAGRININGNGAQLQVLPNDTGENSTSKLTNVGTIEFTAGASDGFKLMTGNVVNQGSILVNHPQSSFQFPGGTSSVPRLTNLGNVAIAPGAQLRVLSATYAQDPTGTLTIGIAGADFGRLVADSLIPLAGTLSVQTSGSAPAIGQQFKIISGSGITGTFGAVQEAGGHYDVAYTATDVTLTAAVPAIDPAACEKAEKKLDKAKKKLKKLKKKDAPKAKIKKAKKKVKKAKEAVAEACS